jgi:Raf kinase inhibitor-like YbhB/YbcL family protein
MNVTSTAFENEQPIPSKYTCDGDDISPPLAWTAGPEGTAAYALIMDDPDAPRGTWVHWVAWNIHARSLPESVPPGESASLSQGQNSWPKPGYGGPCPPSGTHRYYFKIYALDGNLDLGPETDKDALISAMQGHVLARAELMGTYARTPVA